MERSAKTASTSVLELSCMPNKILIQNRSILSCRRGISSSKTTLTLDLASTRSKIQAVKLWDGDFFVT